MFFVSFEQSLIDFYIPICKQTVSGPFLITPHHRNYNMVHIAHSTHGFTCLLTVFFVFFVSFEQNLIDFYIPIAPE